MKVCFITYDLMVPGGLNTVVRNIANSLSECTQLSISILDLNPAYLYKKNELSPKIQYFSLPPTRYRYPIQFWFNLPPIFSLLKRENIDVAFVEGTDAGFFVPPLQPFLKTKLIFCDHGALCNQLDNRKATFIRYMASKLCHHTVVLTEKTRDDYKRIFKLKENRLSVIYNYVECPVANHYNADSKRIMTIGRLTSEKGMDLLVAVANTVLKSHSDWQWDVYGDGPMLSGLVEKTKKIGIEKQLHFLGNVDNAARHMPEYSIYVLPSYREGLPLVLLEALRNRLPMVSFDIDTGPRDIIKDGENGYLIHPYDIGAMSKKICCLIESTELRFMFSQKSISLINNFDKQNIIEQWKHLINNYKLQI